MMSIIETKSEATQPYNEESETSKIVWGIQTKNTLSPQPPQQKHTSLTKTSEKNNPLATSARFKRSHPGSPTSTYTPYTQKQHQESNGRKKRRVHMSRHSISFARPYFK